MTVTPETPVEEDPSLRFSSWDIIWIAVPTIAFFSIFTLRAFFL
jgi:hypothetical protein